MVFSRSQEISVLIVSRVCSRWKFFSLSLLFHVLVSHALGAKIPMDLYLAQNFH